MRRLQIRQFNTNIPDFQYNFNNFFYQLDNVNIVDVKLDIVSHVLYVMFFAEVNDS